MHTPLVSVIATRRCGNPIIVRPHAHAIARSCVLITSAHAACRCASGASHTVHGFVAYTLQSGFVDDRLGVAAVVRDHIRLHGAHQVSAGLVNARIVDAGVPCAVHCVLIQVVLTMHE